MDLYDCASLNMSGNLAQRHAYTKDILKLWTAKYGLRTQHNLAMKLWPPMAMLVLLIAFPLSQSPSIANCACQACV